MTQQHPPPAAKSDPSPSATPLGVLGWQAHFSDQVDADILAQTPPVRVTEVHRSGLRARGDGIDVLLPVGVAATVGDWLLLDCDDPGASRLLERKSLIKRRAPGPDREIQLIAANIDTAFVVTSCNQDFNVARLERYIALAFEAEVAPVIVLTKPDLTDHPETFAQQAAAISDDVPVVTLDARNGDVRAALAPWCKPGQTVAFLGSSGVGKSTLTNAMAQSDAIQTQAIRQVDDRGRHTTTHRQLHFVPGGCAVLDTPGMRELQLTETAFGVSTLFADLEELTTQCRFNDCRHLTEPGCAVRAALESGEIDATRLARWQKLVVEDTFNTATLGQRKSKDKAMGKLIRGVQQRNKKGP